MNDLIPFFIKPVRLGQPVNMVMVQMDSFPPHSNPFHHDLTRMGTPINDEVMIMHSTPMKAHAMTDIIYVNIVTGDRWRMVPVPVTPEYEECFRVRDFMKGDPIRTILFMDHDYSVRVKYHPTPGETSVIATPVGAFKQPSYIWFGNFCVLESFLSRSSIDDLATVLEDQTHDDDKVDFKKLAGKMLQEYRDKVVDPMM